MPADRTLAEDYATPLVDLYTDLESNLAQEIARRLAKGLDSPAWAADKLAATGDLRRAAQAMVAQVQADTGGAIERAIQQAYGQGSRVASAELSDVLGQGLTPAAARGVASALPGQRSIARMVSTLATKLKGTHVPLLRWVEDTYRQVVATTALHPVLAGTATRRQAAERTWQTFLGKGVTGFTDRAGRNWNLATYVEMATRTGVAQAAVEGHLDQMASLGLNLVLVSDAPMECQRCRPWEGKVLSSTGPAGAHTVKVEDSIEDGKMRTVRVAGSVDEAVAAGLLHPNCRHSLSTYLPGLTKQPKATADPEGQKARDTQRDLERRVRKAKTQAAGAIDPAGKAKYDAKAAALQAEIRAHVKENEKYGLRRKPEREAVNLGNRRPAPVVDPAAKRAATRAATRAQFEAVQKARGAADLMAQLDEDAAKGAHVDVLRQHLDYAESTGSTDAGTIATLRNALHSNDPGRLRAALADIAKAHDLTPVGRAGERVKFDPELHDTLPGVDPYEAGAHVLVLRQGHTFSYQGKAITLDRPIVKTPSAPTGPGGPSRGLRGLDEMIADLSGPRVSLSARAAVKAELASGIQGTFAGLETRVTSISTRGGKIHIKGTIHDGGVPVGRFERKMARERGKLVAHHEYLKLVPEAQGSGFAREFNDNLYEWYRRSGFDRVETYANIDVGGYTWATQGFDFATRDGALKWARGAANKLAQARTYPDLMPELTGLTAEQITAEMARLEHLAERIGQGEQISAYEISQLGRLAGQGRDDLWVGKWALLWTSWDGAKPL